MQVSAAQISHRGSEGQFNAHGFHGQGQCTHGLRITGKYISYQYGTCLHTLRGLRQMRVEWQHLQSCLSIVGRSEGHRHQMLRRIRVILVLDWSHWAHRNWRVAEATALAQLFDRPVDTFRRPNNHSRVVEFAIHAVAVQRAAHNPTLDNNQHQ